jgi:hypothetical protein
MPIEKSCDDVIRVRIDTALAVQEFLDQLATQAAEGETRQPANPANRAVFREMAPFCLVEYAYVDDGVGVIDGVYLGFPDGSIYSVADEIPEAVVDALVAGEVAHLPPVYLYVTLAEARPTSALDHFAKALSAHLGEPLVAVFRDQDGCMAAHSYDGEGKAADKAGLDAMVVTSVLEADRHLSKARVRERYAARFVGPAGHAWAQLTYKFTKHVAEFGSVAERDDFIAWSRLLCERVDAGWCDWQDLGFSEIFRPAVMTPQPTGEIAAVPLVAPRKAMDGHPWQAFGGADAATAKPHAEGQACDPRELAMAREYWSYCIRTINGAQKAFTAPA